jgi:hypothetical protein
MKAVEVAWRMVVEEQARARVGPMAVIAFRRLDVWMTNRGLSWRLLNKEVVEIFGDSDNE